MPPKIALFLNKPTSKTRFSNSSSKSTPGDRFSTQNIIFEKNYSEKTIEKTDDVGTQKIDIFASHDLLPVDLTQVAMGDVHANFERNL